MKVKVFDCFTFFNELDLLEFRLQYLDSSVDYFIISESNLTFSGKSKPYNFKDNAHRFDKWKHKIIYLPIEQSTEGLSFEDVKTYTPTNGPWMLESQQRYALSYASNMMADTDLVMLGDIDEIPDPKVIERYSNITHHMESPISLSMLFHYYYMNCQNEGFERWWNGTVLSTGAMFKEFNPQGLRDDRNHFFRETEAGWHFSYLGGVEKIRQKIQSFSHTEFNTPDITSDENIIKAMEEGLDVLKRPGVSYKFYPLDYYPDDLKILMEQYPQFIKLI